MNVRLIAGAVLVLVLLSIPILYVSLLANGGNDGPDRRSVTPAAAAAGQAVRERTPAPAVSGFEAPSRTMSPTPRPTARVSPSPTPVPTPAPAPPSPPPAPVAPPAPDPTAPPPPPPTPPPGGLRSDIAQQLYGLLNAERQANGVAAVSVHGALVQAAEAYAQYHFTHSDPYQLSHYLDGTPTDRAARQGYCCPVGEILVISPGSAESMVELWMDSPGHRAIIVEPRYVSAGIGCYSTQSGGSGPVLCVGVFGPS